MRHLLALACLVSICHAQEQLPTWNSQNLNLWWVSHPDTGQWAQACDELQGRLAASYDKSGPSCFTDSNFNGWFQQRLQTGC